MGGHKKEGWTLTSEELMRQYSTSEDGITDKDAEQRREKYGLNEVSRNGEISDSLLSGQPL